ncbi:DUF302 domain-containing protein [Devosia rhodophyticola]|uniref:DUF302 domain-containing protein n=1 Tax=Devosia rhodophyticola TaxID=3026423 RepID=A0ABY7YZ24_9HYPH|nr:DUF302 domain-containing protein [Devosia rhodophyticola]WDR06265.1 DUF302 domain-containing protein [Devosia rhodophyticola]
MKFLITSITVLLMLASPAFAQEWIVKSSPSTVDETVEKLVAAVEGAGATVFAKVDHAAGAKAVGDDLSPTVLVIFGNPKIGTPIIKADRRAGLDLPLRVLVWSENDATQLGYEDPAALKARYAIEGADDAFAAMTGALDKLTTAATQ